MSDGWLEGATAKARKLNYESQMLLVAGHIPLDCYYLEGGFVQMRVVLFSRERNKKVSLIEQREIYMLRHVHVL